MDEKQIERKRLIWELFTKHNMASIIKEYEGDAKSVFERLEENFKQIIEKFGFKVNKKENLFELNIESQKICAFLRFLTKEKTALALCIENWEGELTASLMQWHDDKNNDKEALRVKNDAPYDWEDETWREVLVKGDLLCKKIDSNPYADDFTEKVMAACEEILGTLAKALE